jgi:hypothetical protein
MCIGLPQSDLTRSVPRVIAELFDTPQGESAEAAPVSGDERYDC